MWNTFVCVNPYLKAFHAEKSILCPGERVLIQIDEDILMMPLNGHGREIVATVLPLQVVIF